MDIYMYLLNLTLFFYPFSKFRKYVVLAHYKYSSDPLCQLIFVFGSIDMYRTYIQ